MAFFQKTILPLLGVFVAPVAYAQVAFQAERAGWLQKAEAAKPQLVETVKKPLNLVRLVEDPAAFQGWKAVRSAPVDTLYGQSLKKQSGAVVDFGEHLTGTVTFTVKALRGTPDAPVRVKLTFGEVPAELATPFDPYPGELSRAWLQDEILTLPELPATVTVPRRLSFRYAKIELLGASRYFDLHLTDLTCRATTSVRSAPAPLAPGTDPLLARIDAVGLATLKECMQTVYEDGPKRDRRLWIGDLYLEAQANAVSFRNHDLTKRCLYLLAALAGDDGSMNSNVFETPEPHPQRGAPFLFDYSLLYNAALSDYLAATNDRATALDLWPLAKKQMEKPKQFLRENGLFDAEAAAKNRWWLFVDWKPDLDRQAPIQGILIFSMKRTLDLAKRLGKENEVPELPAMIEKLTATARQHLLDPKTGLFVSGANRQVSYASQAWMVLGGVATKAEAQRALRAVATAPGAVRQGAPYLFHFYVEAMLQAGLTAEAREAVRTYWGGMVQKGADTFWEVYDPQNERLSPYNFFPVNSYCHAWSCTPVYFIRKYPEVFQR